MIFSFNFFLGLCRTPTLRLSFVPVLVAGEGLYRDLSVGECEFGGVPCESRGDGVLARDGTAEGTAKLEGVGE